MSVPVQQNQYGSQVLEFDVLIYLVALIRSWKTLLASAVCFGLAGALFALSTEQKWEADTRVSIVPQHEPGGIASDERRASEVISIVEHGFALEYSDENHRAITLARMRSREFTRFFMERENVYRHIYPEQWQQREQRWVGDYVPDHGFAAKEFSESMRRIEHNPETGLVSVSIRSDDPILSRDLANALVFRFNEYMRNRALAEVEQKMAFLHRELHKANVVEIEKSIYRLIEAQTAMAMLVEAREAYALEVIDAATLPFASSTVSWKKLTVLAMFVGGCLAAMFVLARVFLSGFVPLIRQAMV